MWELTPAAPRRSNALDSNVVDASGAAVPLASTVVGFGSAPSQFSLNLGSPVLRGELLEESVGSLPHTKQRRRTRNMDELIELVPSLLAVSNFLKTHTCFEMVPNSGKVVVLESQISLLDALSAMSENELFSATVWDATKRDFVGLMSPLQLLLAVVHYRNELLPHAAPDYDYNASNALTSLVASAAAAAKPHSSLSMFSSSADDGDNTLTSSAGGVVAPAIAAQPPTLDDVSNVDISTALGRCTVGSWLCELSPLRVNVPTPAAPLPSAIGSPLLAKRAAKRGLCFIDPDDTLWDACRALLGALDSKLPLVDRDTQSVLCIVTMSRLLACLFNGLRPLPSLLTRSIDMLGVGSFINQQADRPRGHVSPRLVPATTPPPSTRLSTPLGCALAIMAKQQAGSLVLVDDEYRPVTILAAADVPALFRIAVDVPPPDAKQASPAPAPPAVPAPMAEDAPPSLLSMSCGAAMERIAARCQRLLTCERSASLASVLQMLVQNRVHQIVVVDDRGVFDGVVDGADVLRFLCRTV
jgi:CBS domain-containing protein